MTSLDSLTASLANGYDMLVGGGVADLRPLPRALIERSPQCTVYRYKTSHPAKVTGLPVLLVPPLAAPLSCFDLRRGCSLAEHLLQAGHQTYVIDYGEIGFSERNLGLERWVERVIPRAINAVKADSGASAVQLVGWSLGGILALLSVAGAKLPVASVAMVASPFDFSSGGLISALRPLANITDGRIITAVYRAFGGIPSPLVRLGFQAAAVGQLATRPIAVARNIDDREALAQIEAIDKYAANMLGYPGRSLGQIYHQMFRENSLASGRLQLSDRVIDLADVTLPVLAIAAKSDSIVPLESVHSVANLLPNAEKVQLEVAPGGHLGALTGRRAAQTTWQYLDDFLSENVSV